MAAVIQPLMNPGAQVPWLLYGVGVLTALIMELIGVPPLAFALGMYIPLELNTPLVVGGLIAHMISRSSKDKELATKRYDKGILIASGFIAGGAIIGVVSAILKYLDFERFIHLGWADKAQGETDRPGHVHRPGDLPLFRLAQRQEGGLMEKEKIAQAIEILGELDIDLWLVIDRESGLLTDPVMDFVVGGDATWLSFFLFSKNGEKHAIVGNLDIEKFRRAGLFDTVTAYKGSPKDDLLRAAAAPRPEEDRHRLFPGLRRRRRPDPRQLPEPAGAAEGDRPRRRLVSAEDVIAKLRGRKSPEELRRLHEACQKTLEIYGRVGKAVRPGMSEKELAGWITAPARKNGAGCRLGSEQLPGGVQRPPGDRRPLGAHGQRPASPATSSTSISGSRSKNTAPTCSAPGTSCARGRRRRRPRSRRGFAVLLESIRLAFAALKPGARGLDIDAIARGHIVSQGYDEYPHALGHQVGRYAHDGGALLAPAWERYGNLPFIPLEKDQVFTIEPRIYIKDFGVATVEEMVVITADGAEYLSQPQKELYLVKAEAMSPDDNAPRRSARKSPTG